MFAVQCTAKSGLLIAVSKEVQYIVYSLRCVFLPPASPDFGGIAYTAVVPATQKQDRFFFHPSKHQDHVPAMLVNAEGSQRGQCFA